MEILQDYGVGLHGKTALITGGTKGIGKAIADRLARAGAKVVVTARHRPAEGETPHHFIAADLTQPEDASKLAHEVAETLGVPDILVDNVGGMTTPGGGFSTLTDEHWENTLQVNLLAAIRLDRACLPGMLERKSGVIIHISSVAGKYPLWDLNLAYAVAKAGLNCYSKALANEVASKGVRVLTVTPGAVATPAIMSFVEGFARSSNISVAEATEKLMSSTGGVPMRRMAEPEEVASLIGFLVSPAAAYLTGANYMIDGGALPVV